MVSATLGAPKPGVNAGALLLGLPDPVVPEQAATVTEKLGEYLISVGY